MKNIITLLLASALLSSCVEHTPVYILATTEPAKTTTTRSTTTHRSTPKPAATTTTNTQTSSSSGRQVDGRFIRDTPPDELEPAKTIRVEKDN